MSETRWYYGEGIGNPLQYSCLENPRDRGAWWASVYGVARSQTQLMRLSSSSGACRPQDGVASGTTTREGVQSHPSAYSWTKALLSKALLTRARPSFYHPVPPVKKLREISASSTRGQIEEARRTTIPQQLERKLRYRKLIRLKKQSYIPDERTII